MALQRGKISGDDLVCFLELVVLEWRAKGILHSPMISYLCPAVFLQGLGRRLQGDAERIIIRVSTGLFGVKLVHVELSLTAVRFSIAHLDLEYTVHAIVTVIVPVDGKCKIFEPARSESLADRINGRE